MCELCQSSSCQCHMTDLVSFTTRIAWLHAHAYVYTTNYMLWKSGLGTKLFHNYTLPFWCTEHWSSGNLTAPAHMACAEYQNIIIIIPFISDWWGAFQLCYKVLIPLKSGLQVIGVKMCVICSLFQKSYRISDSNARRGSCAWTRRSDDGSNIC